MGDPLAILIGTTACADDAGLGNHHVPVMFADRCACGQAQRLQRRFDGCRSSFMGSEKNEPVPMADERNKPLQRWRFSHQVSI